MVRLTSKGDFSKTESFLKNLSKYQDRVNLDMYAQRGVEALASATPVDTGETAGGWYYKIEKSKGETVINFCNSNVQNGVPIAIILQYGHGTNNGGWVEGQDYINPAIRPVFDDILKAAWKEVTK